MQRSVTATAPGKVIIFGEHAVVYGQPAIAAPVHQAQTTATIEPGRPGSGLILSAVDLDMVLPLDDAPANDPLAAIARLTLAHLDAPAPDATLTVRSTIPIASGMGSGAAVSTAIVRALAAWVRRELHAETVSGLVYEVEKLHHGTPSGIDNTVVAFSMPVYFVRGQPIETFSVGAALHLLVADTGVFSSTRLAVGDVYRAWQADTAHYEALFAQVGTLVRQARKLIEAGGEMARLGTLMNHNHDLLRDMGVSSPELERLVLAAREAGAQGAKLSGAGRGGNMIALLRPGDQDRVAQALRQAGAVRVIETALPASAEGVNAAFNGTRVNADER